MNGHSKGSPFLLLPGNFYSCTSLPLGDLDSVGTVCLRQPDCPIRVKYLDSIPLGPTVHNYSPPVSFSLNLVLNLVLRKF